MKTLLLFLCLTFTLSIAAQKPESTYDRFRDETVIRSAKMWFENEKGLYGNLGFSMDLAAVMPGEHVKTVPDTYILAVYSVSKEWNFLRSNDLYMIADGQRLSFGRARRASEVGRQNVREILQYSLSRDDLATLAAAKSIDVKIGIAEASVKEKDLRALKLFADALTAQQASK